jgi:hypothetical protein
MCSCCPIEHHSNMQTLSTNIDMDMDTDTIKSPQPHFLTTHHETYCLDAERLFCLKWCFHRGFFHHGLFFMALYYVVVFFFFCAFD